MIAAQKAYTANAFSLPGLALSTANLYYATQPGGSLYGLQHSNPVDPALAYLGPAANFGTAADPMDGYRVGGVNVFGGGLALYNKNHVLIGAIGVSGDSSCADHNIAWRTRNNLGLDHVPAGVSGDPLRPDNIVFDLVAPAGPAVGHQRQRLGTRAVQRHDRWKNRSRARCPRPASELKSAGARAAARAPLLAASVAARCCH